jgi:hypothetical protein
MGNLHGEWWMMSATRNSSILAIISFCSYRAESRKKINGQQRYRRRLDSGQDGYVALLLPVTCYSGTAHYYY